MKCPARLRLVSWATIFASVFTAPAAAHGGRSIDAVATGVIEQLAGGRDLLFAIREGAVLMFDGAGSLVGRCGRSWTPPDRFSRRRPPSLDPSDVLRDAGLPDDDSTAAGEEMLDDEAGPERIRRGRMPVVATIVPRALAAHGRQAWAATSDGLYRIAAGGCQPAGLRGRDLVAIAAGATVVAAASANMLFRGEGPDLDPDALNQQMSDQDLWTFRPVAALTTRPRALAVDRGGMILVAGEAGLVAVARDGSVLRLLGRPAQALAACGQTIAVLADDGVYTWNGRTLTRAADRPPVRLLACGPAQRPWVAAGNGLWSSPDAATWTAHQAAAGTRVAALAVFQARAWLASDEGLVPVDLGAGPPSAARVPLAIVNAFRPPGAVPTPARWVWPDVSAIATVDRAFRPTSVPSSTRQTITVFLMLRFPLGGPPPAVGEAAGLAVARVRRATALARAQMAAAAGAIGAIDPSDRAELAAHRDLAADQAEALP